MKPTPLSAMLADDLLLDRVGARLDADDELGSLLLAVAHRADTPIPRATLARRVRPHRGLTVLAALGVAVSGATVAAAVELAPVPPDQASGVPHARAFLPPSLQALVLPFLSGSPFQGRLVLPFGAVPGVPLDGSATAAGSSGHALRPPACWWSPSPSRQHAGGAAGQAGARDQQDAQRQKVQAKGTPADRPGPDSGAGRRPGRRRGQREPVEAAPEPKPKPTADAHEHAHVRRRDQRQSTNGANGQANEQGRGRGGRARPVTVTRPVAPEPERRPVTRLEATPARTDRRRPDLRRPGQGQGEGQGRDRSPRGRRDDQGADHRHDR